MTRKNRQNLNHLLLKAPKGGLLTSDCLKSLGVSTKLAWWYVQSGYLERIGGGLYKLAGDSVDWVSVLHALQTQQGLPVHLGGKNALQLLGKSHYLPARFEAQTLQLFSPEGIKLPRWMNAVRLEGGFALYSTVLFSGLKDNVLGLVEYSQHGLSIQISSPERAAIELCYLVPKVVSFEEAALLVENLARLRPTLVRTLLEACHSLKAKRLFLFLSDYYQHPWLKELVLSGVDLGKGKSVVAGGGVYNAKYKISTPKLGE